MATYGLCCQDVEKEEDGVEELPPELQIKHPLQNTWTLWYYENDRNKTWENNQREITSFDTVEDFWRYNLIHFPRSHILWACLVYLVVGIANHLLWQETYVWFVHEVNGRFAFGLPELLVCISQV